MKVVRVAGVVVGASPSGPMQRTAAAPPLQTQEATSGVKAAVVAVAAAGLISTRLGKTHRRALSANSGSCTGCLHPPTRSPALLRSRSVDGEKEKAENQQQAEREEHEESVEEKEKGRGEREEEEEEGELEQEREEMGRLAISDALCNATTRAGGGKGAALGASGAWRASRPRKRADGGRR